MKKKTNLQEVRPHRTGPLKEKAQVTLRLDMDLMAEVNAQIKQDDARITDAIEQGLLLWLQYSRHQLPAWTKQIRFVLANATREQVSLIRGLAIAMVEGEIVTLSAAERKFYEICKWYLESRNITDHALKALELYSRYGKSAEEIAKLGS